MYCKYGDSGKVKDDIKFINDIISRQGTDLLLDVIAEYIGEMNVKYNMQESEITRLKESLINNLRDAINERT